jgi:uncharacterized protein YeeX (DUF496 family)
MHIEIGEDHLNETGTIRLNPCSLMNNKIAHKNKKIKMNGLKLKLLLILPYQEYNNSQMEYNTIRQIIF